MARRKKNRRPQAQQAAKAALSNDVPCENASLGDRLRPWLLGAAVSLFVARVLFPSESAAAEGDGQVVVMLWMVLGVAWAAGTVSGPNFRVRLGWTDAAVALLIGWHTLAALVAAQSGSPRPALNMLWEWVAMGLAFFLVRQLFTGRSEARAAVAVMIALAVALSTYGLYQYFYELPATRAMYTEDPAGMLRDAGMGFGEDTTARELFENRLESVEPFATFALANSLAAVLATWLVVALGIGIVGFSVRDGPNGSPESSQAGAAGRLARFAARGRWMALLGVGCLAIPVGGCLLLTKSRAGYLATLAGLGLLAVVWWYRRQVLGRIGWKPVIVILAIVALLAIGVWGATVTGGLDIEVLSEASKSLGYRVQYWQSTARMIGDHPWLGAGPGQFQHAYTFYKLPQASEEITDPHNFLLEVWATAGTPAVLALLAVLATFAWSILRVGIRQVGGTTSNPSEEVSDSNREPNMQASAHDDAGFVAWFKKGSGTVVRSTLRAVPATVPDPFLNHAGFVLGGGIVGVLVAVPIALASLAPDGLAAVKVGLLPAILTLAILMPWVRRGHMTGSLPAIGVAVVLTCLLFSGGIGAPGVAGTLWLLVGLGLNTAQSEPPRTISHGAAITALAAAIILAVCCYVTSYRPVTGCRAALAAASAEPARAQFYLEKAQSADRLWARPPVELAAFWYTRWELNQSAAELRALEESCERALRLSPRSAATRHDFAQLYHRIGQATGQPAQIERALEGYRQAVSLYPTNCGYRASLAEILYQTGDLDGFRREAAEALRLDEITPHLDKKLADEQRKQLSRKVLRSQR